MLAQPCVTVQRFRLRDFSVAFTELPHSDGRRRRRVRGRRRTTCKRRRCWRFSATMTDASTKRKTTKVTTPYRDSSRLGTRCPSGSTSSASSRQRIICSFARRTSRPGRYSSTVADGYCARASPVRDVRVIIVRVGDGLGQLRRANSLSASDGVSMSSAVSV
jgi:hypothetical protein